MFFLLCIIIIFKVECRFVAKDPQYLFILGLLGLHITNLGNEKLKRKYKVLLMLIVVQADMLISKFCILPFFKCDSTRYSSFGKKICTFNYFI